MCIYMCIDIYIYIYIYICTFIYVHVHTYSHTHNITHTGGATTQGLGLGYASMLVKNLCTCKAGINKCTHTGMITTLICDTTHSRV